MVTTFIRRYAPLAILVAAFIWSAAIVFIRTWGGFSSRSEGEVTEDRIVLRLAHWQLETGARDALAEMARQYEELHPRVRIEQNAIPDSAYGMWLTTQLTSGTAPDLVQLDAAAPVSMLIPWHVWQGFLQRYFVRMTPFAAQPNPYNAGTDLEGIPLRHTFKDGMRKAYSPHFLEYFAIPLSRFSFRVFYNKDLYEELTGSDIAPSNWREFAEACEAISKRFDEDGDRYIPIANSKVHLPTWEGIADLLTHETVYLADFNHDCFLHNQELWQAIHTDRLSFHHPAIRARFRMMRRIAEFSQEGFTGLMRDDAIFLYVQQRAVFLMVGTNEARSIASMTEGQFDFGVMEMPYPDPDDPEFGDFAGYGKPIEESLAATLSAFMFGIAQTSKHPDEALDFLLYMASRRGNEELNRIVGWLPLTKGAESDDLLHQFEPRTSGVAGGLATWAFVMGAETKIKYDQLYALYLIGQITLDEFLDQYDSLYRGKGLYDFRELLDAGRNERGNAEKLLAQIRSKAQTAQNQTEADSHWRRYRQLMWQSQVLSEAVNAQIRRNLKLGPVPDQKPPWAYTDFALENVRKRITAEREGE